MVLVAPLVVQPGEGYACGLALRVVRAAVALVVFRAGEKFRRGVFAEIMAESLPIEPQTKAVLADQITVPGDGFEMGDRMHGPPPVAWKMLMVLL